MSERASTQTTTRRLKVAEGHYVTITQTITRKVKVNGKDTTPRSLNNDPVK